MKVKKVSKFLPNGANSSDKSTALVKAADGSASMRIFPFVLNWLPQADITKGSLTLHSNNKVKVNQNEQWDKQILPDTNNFINARRFEIFFLLDIRRKMSFRTTTETTKTRYQQIVLSRVELLQTDGVNAPGTANKITFLLAVNSAMLILLAGLSSKRSIDGTLSPS